jgi:hypothetical protein
MSLDASALLLFPSLLEVAHLSAPAESTYDRQAELVAECRRNGAPFLASMPLRSRFNCPYCKVERTEVELHFEAPEQPFLDAKSGSMWGAPVGHFVDIDHSALHKIFVHGEPASAELVSLFAWVSSHRQGRDAGLPPRIKASS